MMFYTSLMLVYILCTNCSLLMLVVTMEFYLNINLMLDVEMCTLVSYVCRLD